MNFDFFFSEKILKKDGFRDFKNVDHLNYIFSFKIYTARNAQVATSLHASFLQLETINAISGCVRIACSDFNTSSLMQVDYRLDASCERQT